MRIETDSFALRQWKDDDAERLFIIANNKKIYDNLRDAFPHPYSIEDAKKYISSFKEGNERAIVFAIEMDGKIIGNIGAFFKDDVYRKNTEIGYYLAEEYWGNGIMTKAIRTIVKYLFDSFDIIRIYAEPFARNTGSRKSLEKAGFRLEAVLKKNIIKNEVIEDSCVYAILKEEFSNG
jgi:RimJ/RimL family protein N-acetyltransferase